MLHTAAQNRVNTAAHTYKSLWHHSKHATHTRAEERKVVSCRDTTACREAAVATVEVWDVGAEGDTLASHWVMRVATREGNECAASRDWRQVIAEVERAEAVSARGKLAVPEPAEP